jgi:hypothetical protein
MVMLTRPDLEAAQRIVRRHVPVTPAHPWPLLEQVTGCPTWVKHENVTPTGAFKVRGGLVYLDRLLATGPVPLVVPATRGNHGQSLAFAGRAHGVPVSRAPRSHAHTGLPPGLVAGVATYALELHEDLRAWTANRVTPRSMSQAEAWRSRYRRVLSRLPHTVMEHHRPRALREVS